MRAYFLQYLADLIFREAAILCVDRVREQEERGRTQCDAQGSEPGRNTHLSELRLHFPSHVAVQVNAFPPRYHGAGKAVPKHIDGCPRHVHQGIDA